MNRTGFTLIEMLVVILIMMMAMATMLPAVAMMQKKSDIYNTPSVIRAVHNTQRSYAMQAGVGGAVYGYTIRRERNGIQPWVWVGTPATSMSKADIGKQMFWAGNTTADYISFTDNISPVAYTQGAGAPANLAQHYIVAFVPGAGFAAVTMLGGTGWPAGSAPTVGLPGAFPDASPSLRFRLRSTRSGFRNQSTIEIHPNGLITTYAP